MPIKILSSELVSQIAAGEVVERPASVVKELVENALDAGASQIAIEARGGGVELIRVVDNGSGIPADDAELAFQRYATSKIGSLADLENISTLGFRGEALPSIAAVAEVAIVTRTPQEAAGIFISLHNGEIVEKMKRGCPPGTTITVRHLFRHIPARLKFLKSAPTEDSHIATLVTQYALAYPEVRFIVVLEGRGALRTSGSGNLKDAVAEVYGVEVAQGMREVASTGDVLYPRVNGLVSLPKVARSSRSYLSFFVNRRWVQSRMLTRAVEEAYQGLLLPGRHPIAVLNITLPPQEVDVNVHPTKTEVRFSHEQAIFREVQRTVRRALVQDMPVPSMQAPSPADAAPLQEAMWESEGVEVRREEYSPAVAPRALHSPLPILRVVGQLASTYIVAEGPDGMYLIDQHAAHERVRYEKLRAQQQSHQMEVQGFLQPPTLELTPSQEQLLKKECATLTSYGFALEPFGERTYLVRSAPAMLEGKDVLAALKELLDLLGSGESAEKRQEEFAISLACHSAVRAGQVLSLEEMQALVRQLEKAELPRTCPHGRPTTIRLSAAQLEKEFGRR